VLFLLQDLFVLGLSDGSALIALLSLDEEHMRFTWQPTKVIVPKMSDRPVAEHGVMYASNLSYDDVTDILLIGNAVSRIRVINNFVRGLESPNKENLPLFSLAAHKPDVKLH
jgi:hypothetical protein